MATAMQDYEDVVAAAPEEYTWEAFSKKHFDLGNKKNAKTGAANLRSWQSESLKAPLCHLAESVDKSLCAQAFKNITGFMNDRRSSKPPLGHAQKFLQQGIGAEHTLRDEMYAQLLKQLTNNPNEQSLVQGWRLLCLGLACFQPSEQMSPYVCSFCLKAEKAGTAAAMYAAYARHALNMRESKSSLPSAQFMENIQAHVTLFNERRRNQLLEEQLQEEQRAKEKERKERRRLKKKMKQEEDRQKEKDMFTNPDGSPQVAPLSRAAAAKIHRLSVIKKGRGDQFAPLVQVAVPAGGSIRDIHTALCKVYPIFEELQFHFLLPKDEDAADKPAVARDDTDRQVLAAEVAKSIPIPRELWSSISVLRFPKRIVIAQGAASVHVDTRALRPTDYMKWSKAGTAAGVRRTPAAPASAGKQAEPPSPGTSTSDAATKRVKVRAKHAYTAQTDNNISFDKDAEFVCIKHETGKPWWYGLHDGNKGWFPSAYVEIVQ
ncbi:MAG: hypothetical protein MHM6MM_005980 [Cercozoa sp. M6MM]